MGDRNQPLFVQRHADLVVLNMIGYKRPDAMG